MDSQLHNQVEVVGTFIDVLQCDDVLMLDPAKRGQTIRKDFYFLHCTMTH